MGYYRGDYYQGSYYQGFPFLGAAIKVGAGLVKKIAPKVVGKIGAAAGKLVGRVGGIARKAPITTGIVTTVAADQAIKRFGNDGGGGGRRRMNVANPKALRRAIRRAHGFAKLARKVLTFPISKPPKGRPLFKKARRGR